MVKVFSILIFFLGALAQGDVLLCNKSVSVNKVEHNFGTLQKGDKAVYVFQITNLKQDKLIVKSVNVSKKSTTLTWTKKPILCGEKGKIEVSYNTNITGLFSSSVYVYTNYKQLPFVLKVKGKVE